MNHPAEIAIHRLLQAVAKGKGEVSDEILDQVAADVRSSLKRQLTGLSRKENFRLRMSNLGRPTCQLWFDKNKPEEATPFPPFFLMQMLIGDVTEAVFKGILKAAGVAFEDSDNVTLDVNGVTIKGSYDMRLDGNIDDVKSASPWSYTNKFIDFETLAEGDSFGYVAQLVAYAKASSSGVGGWWVVNKSNGEFKYVSAANADVDKVMQNIGKTVAYITEDKPFERCFEAEPETFYSKATGNLTLNKNCNFCNYKKSCYPELKSIPKLVTRETTKIGGITDYVYIAPEHQEKADSYIK
jgi:hypothetical protein